MKQQDEESLIKKEVLSDAEKETLTQRIRKMTVSGKLQLTISGSKEVRNFMIRDSNRVVQIAVIKSPKITIQEIEKIAQSRTVDDEVLRLISENKEWLKSYSVKLALVTNPKTPVQKTMKLLPHLQKKDLRNLTKSKNIPIALSVMAKRLYYSKV